MACGLAGNNYIAGDPSLTVAINAQSYASGIIVFWTFPETNSSNVAHFNVYRSTDPDVMTLYRRTAGDHILDTVVDSEVQYYYWVEVVPISGRKPEAFRIINGPVSITSANAINTLLDLLNGDVTYEMLDGTLRERIDSPQLLANQLEEALVGQSEESDNLSTAVQEAQSRSQQIIDDLIQEAIAREDSDAELLQEMNDIKVTADGALAAIEEINIVFTDGEESVAGRLSVIEAELDNARSALKEDILVFADENATLGSLLTSIQSYYDENNSQFNQQINTLSEVDTSLASVTTDLAAIMGLNGATFTEELATQSGLDFSIAHQLETLQAAVGFNNAIFDQDTVAESGLDQSLVSRITSLSSEYGDFTETANQSFSAIDQAVETIANAQESTATEVSQLDSLFFGNKTEQQKLDILSAGILNGSATYADAIQSIAENSQTLQSAINNLDPEGNAQNIAKIDTLLQTIANIDENGNYEFRAEAFTQLTVQGDTDSNSQLTEFSESFVDPIKDIVGSQYTLQLATNSDTNEDVIVGMTIHNFVDSENVNTNGIIFRSDLIGFAGTSTEATEYPFVIDNGFVRMDGAFIQALSITRGQVANTLDSDNYGVNENNEVISGMRLDFLNGRIRAIDGEFFGTLSVNSISAAGGIIGEELVAINNNTLFIPAVDNSSSFSTVKGPIRLGVSRTVDLPFEWETIIFNQAYSVSVDVFIEQQVTFNITDSQDSIDRSIETQVYLRRTAVGILPEQSVIIDSAVISIFGYYADNRNAYWNNQYSATRLVQCSFYDNTPSNGFRYRYSLEFAETAQRADGELSYDDNNILRHSMKVKVRNRK